MPSAQDAKLEYEAGQTVTAMSEITDSGDHKKYTTLADQFSGSAGYTAVIKPNGLITGGAVTPAVSATNDMVDTAALTCYLSGVKTTVNATTDKVITRGATSNTHIINSITVTSAGAIAVVAGTATTAFSETRGAAGGPPFIPVGSIEIAQVRLTSITAGVITASQITQVVGYSQERWDYPIFEEDNFNGTVNFIAALPLIHTGSLPKKVFASYAEPIFAELSNVTDFVPPEQSYSSSSTAIYGGIVGNSSKSLTQGSFTAYLKSAVSDSIVGLAGKNLFFRFYPDKYQSDYIICQGILGLTRTLPAADNITASCTISPFKPAVNVIA